MAVKGKGGVNLETPHDGKTRAVSAAEILVLIFQEYLPSILLIFLFYRGNVHQIALLEALAGIPRDFPAEPVPEKGDGFIKNEVGRDQGQGVAFHELHSRFMVGVILERARVWDAVFADRTTRLLE
jgi:hypothetical protein